MVCDMHSHALCICLGMLCDEQKLDLQSNALSDGTLTRLATAATGRDSIHVDMCINMYEYVR